MAMELTPNAARFVRVQLQDLANGRSADFLKQYRSVVEVVCQGEVGPHRADALTDALLQGCPPEPLPGLNGQPGPEGSATSTRAIADYARGFSLGDAAPAQGLKASLEAVGKLVELVGDDLTQRLAVQDFIHLQTVLPNSGEHPLRAEALVLGSRLLSKLDVEGQWMLLQGLLEAGAPGNNAWKMSAQLTFAMASNEDPAVMKIIDGEVFERLLNARPRLAEGASAADEADWYDAVMRSLPVVSYVGGDSLRQLFSLVPAGADDLYRREFMEWVQRSLGNTHKLTADGVETLIAAGGYEGLRSGSPA